MSVIDASVWVSRFVPQDKFHASSRRWLATHVAAGGLLVSPVLLLAEVAGAVSRRTGDPRLAQRVLETLVRVPALRIVPVDAGLGRAAADLAADLALRGADALYVAVAQALGLPFITWDEDQRERAGRVVAAFSPGTRDPRLL
ncbi:MAG: type II toxin-antitoxin system VapC family toxin [Dehalococcoidia bacterium]